MAMKPRLRPRTRTLISSLVLILMFHGSLVYAFSGGSDTAMLSKIYGQITAQLEQMKEELEAVKATNDAVFTAREHLNQVRSEYEFVRDFRPKHEVAKIVGWADGQTNLNNLDGDNWQQTWSLVSGEIDKRFERSDAPEAMKEEAKADATSNQRKRVQLNEMASFYEEKALETDGDTSKDLQRKTASATSMMASIMLQQRKERLQEEIKKREMALDAMEWDREFVGFLRGDHD